MPSMMMDNRTNIEFLILPFSSKSDDKRLIVCIFSTIYLLGIMMNLVVIAVICLDVHLHSPLYLFFCNLSVIDICYTTVVVPKLLYILLSGNDLVSFTQCFTQMYFFFTAASAEVILFFIMGFDRYVAICHPLHYHQILGIRNCTFIMVIMWACALINSSFYIIPLLNVTFDRVVGLHQFFCDAITVFNSSHGGTNDFFVVIFIECILLGLCPFFCNLVSYIKIFCVIARIKSDEGRRKTLSTCSSHLIVMMIYYSTGVSHFMSSFYHTGALVNQFLSMFYSIIVPMINPLIYSLRNNEIKKALQRLLMVK